ncbi:hypothetical protein GGR50DRAFT_488369 [Xylaria sp. CBS 124048]|nr:hypothetical protein GGR50DRAFT_488369 [Xylaria sp. CBS 124048]
MATRLPGALSRRPTTALPFSPLSAHTSTTYLAPSHTPLSHTPSRAATMIRRPKRPYTFTQLVQLSDGSTYTMRTSSPLALYKSAKDTRNHPLWNPNEKSLQNVEVDEAGKLAAFRGRFGRGWDASAVPADDEPAAADESKSKTTTTSEDDGMDAMDLISRYAVGIPELPMKAPVPKKKK